MVFLNVSLHASSVGSEDTSLKVVERKMRIKRDRQTSQNTSQALSWCNSKKWWLFVTNRQTAVIDDHRSKTIYRPKMIVWSGAIIHPLMILLNHWHHRRHLNNHLYCRHHHHQTEMKIRPCSFHLLHKSLYDKSFPLQIDQFSIHNASYWQFVCMLHGKAYTTLFEPIVLRMKLTI